jgi:hypothetical protein
MPERETRHAVLVNIDPNRPGRPANTGRHIVYLDPHSERAVSPYSPEGEIKMMGEFAAGLSRRGAVSRPMAILLVVLILAPILLSVLAMVTGW